MPPTLDHFFIFAEPGAPEAELLIDLGLIEGDCNHHPGQGTANRRFFFSNSMLEFLYVRDAEEARSGPGRELRLVERSSDPNASPFGLILRGDRDSAEAPFPGWRYYPDYLDGGRYLLVGDNSDDLGEPLCVFVPFETLGSAGQPLCRTPFGSISEIRVSIPAAAPSAVLGRIALCEGISLRCGEPHRLEVVFDQGRDNRLKDFRPALPVLFRW